jgi:hypothetical protein
MVNISNDRLYEMLMKSHLFSIGDAFMRAKYERQIAFIYDFEIKDFFEDHPKRPLMEIDEKKDAIILLSYWGL